MIFCKVVKKKLEKTQDSHFIPRKKFKSEVKANEQKAELKSPERSVFSFPAQLRNSPLSLRIIEDCLQILPGGSAANYCKLYRNLIVNLSGK